MCRFTGSKHRDYLPTRLVKLTNLHRLPTILEVTEETESNKPLTGVEEKRHGVVGGGSEENVSSPVFTTMKGFEPKKAERHGRCIIPSLTKPQASLSYQKIQDEWNHFLRTPYADFLPTESRRTSFMRNRNSPSTKRTQTKPMNTDTQAPKLSEIAAWLEFFG